MPKDHFSVQNAKSLHEIPKGGRIHVIGVSGVAMAQLAVALSQSGYQVSGSDKEFYEPMGSYLRGSKVVLRQGYDAANVPDPVDLVVIGNAVSYGHPEVDVVEKKNLPYTLFPKVLHELVIAGRHSIVACGTHGKTTTTALVATVLSKLGLKPSYFIGGICEDLPSSLHVGEGGVSVVEGDEYDSCFFAKVPKFDFYAPDTCIVNAVEFDHADIYPDLGAVNRVFTLLADRLPKEGTLIACPDYPNLADLVKAWRSSSKCSILTFGLSEGCDYRIAKREQKGRFQKVTVETKSGSFQFELPLIGLYNAKNALATIIALASNGIERSKVIDALKSYKAVKRRQEVRYEGKGVVLIEDFAHHPTAVHETVDAIREAYPDKKLWAVFEPRSNTSRRKVFQDDYVKAFAGADKVILCEVAARGAVDTGQALLDVATLSDEIAKTGKDSITLPNAAAIADHILATPRESEVLLIMSNGSFGGLISLLEAGLRKGDQ